MNNAPKPTPTAVRLGEERLAHVEAWGHAQGIRSRHAAILAAIDKGAGFKPAKAPTRKKGPAKVKEAKAVLASAEEKAAHLAKPKPRKKAKEMSDEIGQLPPAAGIPTTPKRRWDLGSVQVGPTSPARGSMLKGKK